MNRSVLSEEEKLLENNSPYNEFDQENLMIEPLTNTVVTKIEEKIPENLTTIEHDSKPLQPALPAVRLTYDYGNTSCNPVEETIEKENIKVILPTTPIKNLVSIIF